MYYFIFKTNWLYFCNIFPNFIFFLTFCCIRLFNLSGSCFSQYKFCPLGRNFSLYLDNLSLGIFVNYYAFCISTRCVVRHFVGVIWLALYVKTMFSYERLLESFIIWYFSHPFYPWSTWFTMSKLWCSYSIFSGDASKTKHSNPLGAHIQYSADMLLEL